MTKIKTNSTFEWTFSLTKRVCGWGLNVNSMANIWGQSQNICKKMVVPVKHRHHLCAGLCTYSTHYRIVPKLHSHARIEQTLPTRQQPLNTIIAESTAQTSADNLHAFTPKQDHTSRRVPWSGVAGGQHKLLPAFVRGLPGFINQGDHRANGLLTSQSTAAGKCTRADGVGTPLQSYLFIVPECWNPALLHLRLPHFTCRRISSIIHAVVRMVTEDWWEKSGWIFFKGGLIFCVLCRCFCISRCNL